MAKILIVEDDPLMSRLYHQAFTLSGFEVELAHDGQEGLEKARVVKPNFIILDVMMPRMNGMQVLENLKADPNIKDVPVLMLTNLGGQQDAEAAVSKGAVKYIAKSDHEPVQVVAMVKELLGMPATPAAAPAPAAAPQAPATPAAAAPTNPTDPTKTQ